MFYKNSLKNPIKTISNPETKDQILGGREAKRQSFFPKRLPILKNISWKVLINIGNQEKLIPKIPPPIPIEKQSKDKARPNYLNQTQ